MRLLFFIGIGSLFTVNISYGQVKESNNDIWLHYFGKNMITEKFSFSFEATMRYANGFSEKQQYFIRPSVDYQFAKKHKKELPVEIKPESEIENKVKNKKSIDKSDNSIEM